jgi:hypothetical protein
MTAPAYDESHDREPSPAEEDRELCVICNASYRAEHSKLCDDCRYDPFADDRD